ncbi:MAG: hypothetical protein MUE42_11750, partial [Opitutaceae bacterium]|nr:hypothetical protein [Opitutaceae bacterium]
MTLRILIQVWRMAALFFAAGLAMAPLRSLAGGVLDTLVLGDPASELTHRLSSESSETLAGGLGEPARRLLPLSPVSHNGGFVRFHLKVDPVRQNYVTVKLWGSDRGMERGRLLLILDGNLQVGYRHEGDHDVLNQSDDDPLYLDRFVYQTVALPLAHTQGKTEVDLKIAALGRMWPYGQTFQQKQKSFTVASRGIYRVYTHTAARFEPPADERQGLAPADKLRPPLSGDEIMAKMRGTVNSRLGRLLADQNPARPGARGADQRLLLLAEAYHTPWTVAYKNPATIAALLRAADEFMVPGWIGPQWTGAGPLGEAIARIGPDPLLERALEELIDVPVEHPFVPVVHHPDINSDATHVVPKLSGEKTRMTRREAWARFLQASVDWNRRTGRRPYTNQSMIVDFGIYTANRGLALIEPSRALPEAQALRYLHEAAGIIPWTGNDLPDGGSDKRYGADYFLVSRKGISRELGWVGTYGETILKFTRDMAELSGDPRLREQLVKLQTQRLFFRYPSVDADGYRSMRLTSEIDNRNARFPKESAAYIASDIREDWWMAIAAYSQDLVSVGAVQQMLADNQYFPRLARRIDDTDTTGMMRNIDEYETVKLLPPSPARIPATRGQPDYAFADEENAVLALKHGDRQLFVNFYFRQERGVSGATRILEVEPAMLRIATVLSDFELDATGEFWTRRDHVDFL